MVLTQKKIQNLVWRGFPDLSTRYQRLWKEKADRAYADCSKNFFRAVSIIPQFFSE